MTKYIALVPILLCVAGNIVHAARDARITISLEEPVQGDRYSGISNLRGWAVSPVGVGDYYFNIYIDGEFQFYMPVGGNRSDVASAYPNYPNSDMSGFSMAFNYKDLSPGEHTVTVRAYDNNSNFNEVSATFISERFVSEFISEDARVDLSTVESVSLSNKQSLLLRGAKIEGKRWDFTLRWDKASQSFKTWGITDSAAAGSFFAGSESGSNNTSSGGSGSGLLPSGSSSTSAESCGGAAQSGLTTQGCVDACLTSPERTFTDQESTVYMEDGAAVKNPGFEWRGGAPVLYLYSETREVVLYDNSEYWYAGRGNGFVERGETCLVPNHYEVKESWDYSDTLKQLVTSVGNFNVGYGCSIHPGAQVYSPQKDFKPWVLDLITGEWCFTY